MYVCVYVCIILHNTHTFTTIYHGENVSKFSDLIFSTATGYKVLTLQESNYRTASGYDVTL